MRRGAVNELLRDAAGVAVLNHVRIAVDGVNLSGMAFEVGTAFAADVQAELGRRIKELHGR
ncbi:MAG TPA: hypothetical protein VHX59_22000 [Mycobacteriales bacterium]|nr:hypothetical protein [Mycobacteriales bacterium]